MPVSSGTGARVGAEAELVVGRLAAPRDRDLLAVAVDGRPAVADGDRVR
jgi:hypothetical protein